MNTWAEFFAVVDALPEEDERVRYMALLQRNFAAAGYPTTWPKFDEAAPEQQERLTTEWLAWALRDVSWIALRTFGEGRIRC